MNLVVIIDCKTVGFFLKISKEIGKAWRKSLTARECEAREKKSIFSVSLQSRSLFSASFDCSRVLEYAKIRTVLQSMVIRPSKHKVYRGNVGIMGTFWFTLS